MKTLLHLALATACAMTLPAFAGEKLSNKQKAVALLKSLETGDTAAHKYINAKKYKQHNLMAPDGYEGFAGFTKSLPKGVTKVRVVRAYQDGDYVFTQSEGDVFGPKVFFDVFKFENGLIVEHWDNMTETAKPNLSGHTQTDGPTEVADREKTAANKKAAGDLYQKVFVEGQYALLPTFFDGDTYVQHNSHGADGLSGLNKMLEGMAKAGQVMKIEKVRLTLGEGNFVLIAAEGVMGASADPKPAVFYDLFRVEKGKVAEHWDVIEFTLPKDKWANSNGKF